MGSRALKTKDIWAWLMVVSPRLGLDAILMIAQDLMSELLPGSSL